MGTKYQLWGLLMVLLIPRVALSDTDVLFCSSFEEIDGTFLGQLAEANYSRKSERLTFHDLRADEVDIGQERVYFFILRDGAIDTLDMCLSYIDVETSRPRTGIISQMESLGQPSSVNGLIPFLPGLGGIVSGWAAFDVPGGVIVSLVSVDDLELVEIDLEVEFRDSEYLSRHSMEAN
jgi:hypothetical protein